VYGSICRDCGREELRCVYNVGFLKREEVEEQEEEQIIGTLRNKKRWGGKQEGK
jgi:hypothetical protein